MPLTEAALMRRATAYLARRAASAAAVRAVLTRATDRQARRAARDGGAESSERDVDAERAALDAVLERLRRAGLVDDTAYGRAKAGSLARKGKPAGIIAAELRHRHGIDPGEDSVLADSLGALDPLAQATRWAERKRLGPFRVTGRDGDPGSRRERDIAALARAGFSVGVARRVVDGDGTVPDGND